MKKPSRKKKRQRKEKSVEELREPRFSALGDALESLMLPKKQGWLYFGFFFFLALFLGVHLYQAAINLAVPNIRTTDTVYFDTMPTWFTVVVLVKLAFWLFSVTYIAVFIKKLIWD
ncbi:hypothetical protein HMF8227_01093 [Saliniradius amylolyticus]|uniref:Uncharacterized protein n=1 Tax=Saliniradius amylolyticus TaxID=2183582 RepID=A0A2S2E1V8_9ALTE|nr:hypothetical protein [Saliniradius amylolyticus]AWL11579.1 hypothetical protein HMF8227_01093 [Saliniradius amylolyticus]